MQEFNCNSSKLAYLYPIIFFCALSTLVRSWIPAFNSAWPMLLVGCVLSVYLANSFFLTRSFAWIIVYSAIVMLNFFIGDEYFNSSSVAVNEFVDLFLLSIVTYYFFESDTPKQAKSLETGLLFLIIIASVGSIVVDAIFPGAVRESSSWQNAENVNNIYLQSYYKMGMSNYLLPHGLPIIIPPLFYLIFQNNDGRRKRIFYLGVLLFAFILIFLSGSTTSLVLAVAASFLSYIFYKYGYSKPGLFLLFGVLFLIILLFPDVIGSFANILNGGENENAKTFSSHLLDAEDYLHGDTKGNTSSRMELYSESFSSFLSNPFTGINTDKYGGHSAILDRLSTLGLIGIVPLIMVFKSQFQYVKARISESAYPYYLLSFIIGIAMLILKNMFHIDILIMLFLLSPIMLLRR